MKRMMPLLIFVFLVSATCLAGDSTSGYLVDSNCYQTTQRHHGGSTSTAERDMKLAIKHCAPTPQTKSFGVVGKDWSIVNLDSEGNTKAAELLRKTAKQSMYRVTVAGDKDQNALKVDSISMAQ